MKLYFSTEARVKAIKTIRDLQVKIGHIPGQYLSYSDAMTLTHLLSDLMSVIQKEDTIEIAQNQIKDYYEESSPAEAKVKSINYMRTIEALLLSKNEANMLRDYIENLYNSYSKTDSELNEDDFQIIKVTE